MDDDRANVGVRLVLGLLAATVVLALVALLAVMALSLQIRGHSMEPTLSGGQRVLANPFVGSGDLERFDIITLDPPGSTGLSVKRLVGMPGDHVRIYPDHPEHPVQVRVGGTGPWLAVLNPAWEGWDPRREVCCSTDGTGDAAVTTAQVPDGNVWVLGDNIAHSDDSRGYGWVPIEDVSGRLWRRVWPLAVFDRVETTVSTEPVDSS